MEAAGRLIVPDRAARRRDPGPPTAPIACANLTLTATPHLTLVALRADGTTGDAAFQRVEEELDWAEMDWARLVQAGQRDGTE